MSMVGTSRDGAPEAVAVAAPVAAGAVEVGGGQPIRRHRSLWGDAWRRLIRNKLAMCGLFGICVLLFLTLAANWIMPYDYDYQHFGNIAEPPSAGFPLGTDLVGRDMLSRMIYGARVSMSVALVAQIVVLLIAIPIGTPINSEMRTTASAPPIAVRVPKMRRLRTSRPFLSAPRR